MKIAEMLKTIKERGISPLRLKKIELIRGIQKQEGHESCYARPLSAVCDRTGCLRYADCMVDSSIEADRADEELEPRCGAGPADLPGKSHPGRMQILNAFLIVTACFQPIAFALYAGRTA